MQNYWNCEYTSQGKYVCRPWDTEQTCVFVKAPHNTSDRLQDGICSATCKQQHMKYKNGCRFTRGECQCCTSANNAYGIDASASTRQNGGTFNNVMPVSLQEPFVTNVLMTDAEDAAIDAIRLNAMRACVRDSDCVSATHSCRVMPIDHNRTMSVCMPDDKQYFRRIPPLPAYSM